MVPIEEFWRVDLLDSFGNFYSNAYIDNSHDAILVCQFYRNVLGYVVKLFDCKGADRSFLIDSAQVYRIEVDNDESTDNS